MTAPQRHPMWIQCQAAGAPLPTGHGPTVSTTEPCTNGGQWAESPKRGLVFQLHFFGGASLAWRVSGRCAVTWLGWIHGTILVRSSTGRWADGHDPSLGAAVIQSPLRHTSVCTTPR